MTQLEEKQHYTSYLDVKMRSYGSEIMKLDGTC